MLKSRQIILFFLSIIAIVPEMLSLDNGLSFIIRAKNEEENVRMCIQSLLPLLADDRVEIIFVDNQSTDNTYSIVYEYQAEKKCNYACEHSHCWKNIKLYSYDKPVLRVGSEHREKMNDLSVSTLADYYNWCLDKATKKNVIKWDADFVANIDNLKEMIQQFRLLERDDKFGLWCTGETVFIEKNQWFKKHSSYYDEFRVFSKHRGFRWETSPDKRCETSGGSYLGSLTEFSQLTHKFSDVWNTYNHELGGNHTLESIEESFQKWIQKHMPEIAHKVDFFYRTASNKSFYFMGRGIEPNWKMVGTINSVPGRREVYLKPVFYELKRADKNEFENRSDMIDVRDHHDYKILTDLANGFVPGEVKELKQKCFCIVVPSYNCAKWLEKCLKSVENQTYDNYRVCVIDDASTDKQHAKIAKLFCEKNGWELIVNKQNEGALYNIKMGIEKITESDDDIIVTLDGDDWFSTENALQLLNLAYQENIELTYGRFFYYRNGEIGFSENYPDHIRESRDYRKYGWVASHLRTFKYKLWRNIKDCDLRDENGEYFRVAWDMAFMFPMIEMAGNNIKFFDYPVYVYNIENELNDFKLRENEQSKIEAFLRKKEVYSYL